MHVIPNVLLFLRVSLDICRFKACLPALFGTVQYETLIPVLFCMLVASGPPSMVVWTHIYHAKVVLGGSGDSAAGAWLGTMASDCLGMFLPGWKTPRPLKSGADASDVSRPSHGSREA
jgi:hypothetical protein